MWVLDRPCVKCHMCSYKRAWIKLKLRCQDGRQVCHLLVCHYIVIWKAFKHREYILYCCWSRISPSWKVLALITGRTSEMFFKEWFCCLDSRKRLCKSHPHEKGGNMKGICWFIRWSLWFPTWFSYSLPTHLSTHFLPQSQESHSN